MQMAKILKSLDAGVKCLMAQDFHAIYRAKAMFHNTRMLLKKSQKDSSDPLDCPETKTTECLTLNPRQCSPTDPPVRPCSEQDCPAKPRKSCCVNTRLSQNVCHDSTKKGKSKQKGHQWESMWATQKSPNESTALMWDYPPECCVKCDNARFDLLYYRPSDKFRKFQRTWWECCPRMVPKRVCCFCDAIPPEQSKRCLPLCPRTACVQDHEKKRLSCLNAKAKDCMRLTMPCCRSARVPPRCDVVRRPTVCAKVQCPYPSYSECQQMELAANPERPPECHCLDVMPKCISLRAHSKMTYDQLRFCPCPKC